MQKYNPKFMEMAFELASKGANKVYPNPFVGALVVNKGTIAGQGWHEYSGGPHAEINAINDAKEKAKGSDLYVTLEPCSTYGKTPPCTKAIAEAGIKKIYFGAYDRNKVNRKKAEKELINHGIKAIFVDFQDKNDELNNVFNYSLKSELPYIQLKAAVSIDGKICDTDNNSKWITNSISREKVHELRMMCDAILIGASTFNRDNPSLNVRIKSKKNYKDPAKIILSNSLKLKYGHNLLSTNTDGEVFILTHNKKSSRLLKKIKNKNCSVLTFKNEKKDLSLKTYLTTLKKRGYHNILVEGGSTVFEEFLKNRLFNEIHIFIGPFIFGSPAKVFSGNEKLFTLKQNKILTLKNIEQFNNDIYLRYIKCLQE